MPDLRVIIHHEDTGTADRWSCRAGRQDLSRSCDFDARQSDLDPGSGTGLALDAQHFGARHHPPHGHRFLEAGDLLQLLVNLRLGHKGSFPLDRLQQSLFFRHGDRLPNRNPADVKLLAQLPFGGDLCPHRPFPGFDLFFKIGYQLFVQRLA